MHDADTDTQNKHQGRRSPGRQRHRRDDFGVGAGYGPQFRGGRGGRGGRRRMRRGDVRAAMLVLLCEEPRNGYQLMQEIEERSDGAWRPSPGSVYPALSQLEDQGLVKATKSEGRKQFTLTPEGEKYVKENAEKLGEPWKDLADKAGSGVQVMRHELKPLTAAVGQLMHFGNDEEAKRGAEILADARRKIYEILAESSTDADS